MKMKLIVSNVLFFLTLITSFKTSYNTVPYTRPAYNTYLTLPWHVHVCPAFPYCTQDLTTGRWYSDPTVSLFGLSNRKIIEKNSINKEIQADFNPRDSDDSFSKCMFEEEYCSTSDSIAKYESDDVESASKCQEYCENNKDCKFWTFLRLRGKTTCSLLPECSAKTKCPSANKLSCASGPKRCTCPALVKTGGSEEDSKYARWNCGETSYEKELDVGTKCTTTCGNWRNAKNEIIVVESECLLGGDWSTTRDIARQALTYANYYSWAKPSEDDMRCGCDTITVSGYDPNSEEGADFVCEESKDFSGDWQLTTSDQCELYCNKDFAASFECVAGAWAGEPERGFWCYTNPQVEVKVGGSIFENLPVASAILSSTHDNFLASRCIDGNTGSLGYNTMCHSDAEKYPWLAIDLGKSVKTSSITIYNRPDGYGSRLRDCEVRISDNLPSTPATASFKGGAQLGFFEGPGKDGEVIEIVAERPLAGRFIVIMNNSNGRFGAAALNLAEVSYM